MSVKYQIPPSKQWAVLPCSLICHCKCHHFILSLATVTGPTLSPALSAFAFHSPCYKDPPLSHTPFLSFFFLFFFNHSLLYPLSNTWQMIAPVKVFSVSILHFPKREQKRRGDKLSAAGFTEKIVQNCLIPGQISECIQSQAKCYCALQFGHYTLSFPFREPLPN